MPFNILELGKDISSLIWGKLGMVEKFMVMSSTKGVGNEYFIEMYNNVSYKYKYNILSNLTLHNCLNIMKILDLDFAGRNRNYDEILCSIAAEEGHFQLLKWLKERGFMWDKYICMSAAKGDQLDILKWLIKNGCSWHTEVCSYAASNGNLEMLKWARKNGCPWNRNVCAYAAENGHFEILKWARKRGCEWAYDTCVGASRGGHLEILKWALNGCSWSEWVYYEAAMNGHVDILQWAKDQNYKYDYETLCIHAERKGHDHVIEWNGRNGCSCYRHKNAYLKPKI